jgi:integrase
VSKLQKDGYAHTGINKRHVAAVSAVFGWLLDTHPEVMSENPAKGVSAKKPRGETAGQPVGAYSREEVAGLLRAARCESSPLFRWTPWILAFTGARIGEALALRKEDFRESEGIQYVHLPGTKTDSAERDVPLHSALVAEGLLEFVASRPDGTYIFEDVARAEGKDKYGNPTKTPAERLRKWIRPKVPPKAPGGKHSPCHSFRHALKAEGEVARIGEPLRIIMGHAPEDVHAAYGRSGGRLLGDLRAGLELIPSPLDMAP